MTTINYPSFENLLLEIDNGVARLTINRPDKLNALNRATIDELRSAFACLNADNNCRSIILTGSGDKAFVAGADISEINTLSPDEALQFSLAGQELMLEMESLGKPIIAAINGFALGGGCELALACTIRIASENAKLGLPEITLGLMPGFGGTQRMARIAGSGRALDMALTGKQIDAQTALQYGLVTAVESADDLSAAVDKLAGKLARSAPIAARHIIGAIVRGADSTMERGVNYESQLFALCCATDDMREGTAAFLEKRKAEFSGK